MMETVVHLLATPLSSTSTTVKKAGDELFGEMVTSMLQEIPNPRKKDFVKLEIQKILLNAKYEDGY